MSRHIMTLKHQNYVNGNKMETKNTYICKNCDKIYRSRVGLWKHNKTCNSNNSDDESNDESNDESDDMSLKNLVLNLAIQNQEVLNCYTELQKENMELKKQTTEVIKQNSDVTNKVFELCKNGITKY